jgi:5-methylcytosine-specific restriction endonuclease McrA
MLLPASPPVVGPDLFVYYAAVKAVVHLQLYEGIKLRVAFANEATSALGLTFSFTMEEIRRNLRVWASPDFYGDIRTGEAEEATRSEADAHKKTLVGVLAESIALAPYRDEHFQEGHRSSIPNSWKIFLLNLTARKCTLCSVPLSAGNFQIDHGRAISPDNDQCRPTARGNSNIFNLGVLCSDCNRHKSNNGTFFPERHIPSLITSKPLMDYFLASLQIPPSKSKHMLAKSAQGEGQF